MATKIEIYLLCLHRFKSCPDGDSLSINGNSYE